MYFSTIFLLILSTIFVKADLGVQVDSDEVDKPVVRQQVGPKTQDVSSSEEDNVASIDEQVAPLGTDNVFCLFTYGNWVMPANMLQDIPNAIYAGVSRLPYNRLDFSYYSEELNGSFPTIVPDCGYEVWGSVYLIPVQDLDQVLLKGGIVDGKKVFHFVQTIVEAYSNGNIINVKCNAFQQSVLPRKLIYGLPVPQKRRPSQQILDMLTEAYRDGHLPDAYINEISQLPTSDQGYSQANAGLKVQPQQKPAVVVAPPSVVVAQNEDPQATTTTQYGVPPMPHNNGAQP